MPFDELHDLIAPRLQARRYLPLRQLLADGVNPALALFDFSHFCLLFFERLLELSELLLQGLSCVHLRLPTVVERLRVQVLEVAFQLAVAVVDSIQFRNLLADLISNLPAVTAHLVERVEGLLYQVWITLEVWVHSLKVLLQLLLGLFNFGQYERFCVDVAKQLRKLLVLVLQVFACVFNALSGGDCILAGLLGVAKELVVVSKRMASIVIGQVFERPVKVVLRLLKTIDLSLFVLEVCANGSRLVLQLEQFIEELHITLALILHAFVDVLRVSVQNLDRFVLLRSRLLQRGGQVQHYTASLLDAVALLLRSDLDFPGAT